MVVLLDLSLDAHTGICANLPYSWLCDIFKILQSPQRIGVCSDDKNHDTYSQYPKGYKNALLPERRLLLHFDVNASGCCLRQMVEVVEVLCD